MVVVQTRRGDLREGDPTFLYAADALAKVGGPAVIRWRRCSGTGTRVSRCVPGAAHCLGRIGRAALACLSEALDAGDPAVRRLAAGVLADVGDATAVASLRALLDDEDAGVRAAAKAALTRLGSRKP